MDEGVAVWNARACVEWEKLSEQIEVYPKGWSSLAMKASLHPRPAGRGSDI
jgi:hypothetical protein